MLHGMQKARGSSPLSSTDFRHLFDFKCQGDSLCLFEVQPTRTVNGIVTYINQSSINPDSVTAQLTAWSSMS